MDKSHDRKQLIAKFYKSVKICQKALGITRDDVIKRVGFTKPMENCSNEELLEAINRMLVSLKFTENQIKKHKGAKNER